MQGHDEEHSQHWLDPPGKERERTQHHGDNLEALGRDEDGALAEDVGRVTRVAGEEKEGQDEDHPREREIRTPAA